MPEKNLTVGIVGGGQLGMMLAAAGKKLGLKTVIFSDLAGTPASLTADRVIVAQYDDKEKLLELSNLCDVITYEFENIPFDTIQFLEAHKPVFPDKNALKTFQNRVLEKEFLKNNGIPCADFAVVRDKASFSAAVEKIGLPAILKTAGMGYDGKGQYKLKTQSEIEDLLDNWVPNEYVLEEMVDLAMEFSVVASRDEKQIFKSWDAIENEHRNHILHISVIPGRIDDSVSVEAEKIAKTIAEKINYCGVFCTEFFLTTGGKLLVNEIAPRVHNSGHLTIEASNTSQFEQHMRAVGGMDLADTKIKSPAAMLNILGDLMIPSVPDWNMIEGKYSLNVHMYGKKEAKQGRKMGHLTLLAENSDLAYKKAEMIFNELSKNRGSRN